MKKIVLLFVMMVSVVSLALAQRTITGTITDDSGEPLVGANVVVKGSTPLVGVSSDADGQYSIKVPSGYDVLVFTYLGFDTQEETLGESNIMDVAMSSSGNELDRVEVTALGLKVDRDKSASSSTQVSGGSVVRSGESGVIQGLAGKTSGVYINRSAGDPGAGANILIRGQSTITGSLQPLIVIDGMPISNNSVNTTEIFDGQPGQTQGVVEQSRLNDINPDDIESMEVLKGAAAAALWGTRAANGVIIITTKKGKFKQGKKFSVDFRSTFSIDQINRKHPLQSTWGQGNYMSYGYDPASGSSTGNSWGDKISDRSGAADVQATSGNHFIADDGTVYYRINEKNSQETFLESNFDAVFRTGHYWENALSLSSAGEDGSVYVSIADMNQKGIIRNNSDYRRTSLRVNADHRFGDKFKASVNAMYSRVSSNRIQSGSNLAGLYLGLLRNSPDYDIRDYKGTFVRSDGVPFTNSHRGYRRPLGSYTSTGGALRAPAYNNPLWTINEQGNTSGVNRYVFGTEFSYDPTSWLNFTLRSGVDAYNDERTSSFPYYSAGFPTGRLIETRIAETQFNTDAFARLSKSFSDNFKGSAVIGFNYNRRDFDQVYATIDGFTLPDAPLNLNNSGASSRTTVDEQSTIITNAGYLALNFDLFDQVTVDLTGRMENASTFGPQAKSTFFYPSASAAWQFSKLLPESNIFSFGKLRLAYGQVGVQPEPYLTTTDFVTGYVLSGWGEAVDPSVYGPGSFVRSDIQGNSKLAPERKSEFEIGGDFRFIKNRLSLGLTYYSNKTTGAIFAVDVPASTGFRQQYANAATLTNKGVELDLSYDVIKGKDFTWNVFGNFSKNKNMVSDLAGVKTIFLNGFEGTSSRAVEGYALGALWGASFETATDGTMVLDEYGFPTQSATEGVIGDPNPDWRGAIGSGITWKGLNFSFMFETAQGMDMWGGTRGVLTHFGVHEDTDVETTLTEAEAMATNTYGGSTVFDDYDGVADGSSVTFRGQLHQFNANGPVVALDQTWYQTLGGGFGPVASQFIYDASWTRLREVSLSYRIDGEGFQKASRLSAVEIGFTARNLFLWTPFVGIDPDTNLTGTSNGRGLDYFTNPGTRSFLLTLKVSY